MTINSAQLLKRLEPAVRPGGTIAPAQAAPHRAFEHQTFDQILSLVADGKINSGRPIELGFEASPPLTAAQVERLAGAADQAEAAGARVAVMIIDGRGFILDVENRTLTSELNGQARIAMIDAAVFVASDDDAQFAPLAPPPGSIIPAAIARQMDDAIVARKA